LVRLLERKYKPTRGEVLLNDSDASLYDLGTYRSMIAVVPDRVKIFNATIAENIVLGRDSATFRQVSEWVGALGLGPFLSRFSNGPLTSLGEDGWRLSSGESQIIGLLRALWGQPGILVIDEGISAIDSDMESRVFQRLREYSQRNAVLLISHRLEQLTRTDYVYVLSNGSVKTEGAPAEWLDRFFHGLSLGLSD
jgi:ABC-type multidrug transport system fused ATPase/permease subunit